MSTWATKHLFGLLGSPGTGTSQCSHWLPAAGISVPVVSVVLKLIPLGTGAPGFGFSANAFRPTSFPPGPKSTLGSWHPGSTHAPREAPTPFAAVSAPPSVLQAIVHSAPTRHTSPPPERHTPGAKLQAN